jgi:hypothetical protein
MVHHVVDPLEIIKHGRVDAVLVPEAAAVAEACDALHAVGESGLALEGADQAAAAVSGAGVGFAGGPAGTQHVGSDEEVSVRPSAHVGWHDGQLGLVERVSAVGVAGPDLAPAHHGAHLLRPGTPVGQTSDRQVDSSGQLQESDVVIDGLVVELGVLENLVDGHLELASVPSPQVVFVQSYA